MKIVLVFPPFYLESMYNLPPLGLINLATSLKGSSHEVVIHDFVLSIRNKTLPMGKHIYDECADRILAEKPDMVGFSAQCTTYPTVIEIAEIIKRRAHDVKIVIGGHNASFVDRLTLNEYPFIDAVIRGEGEITFKELVEAYSSSLDMNNIPGLTYRDGKKIIINKDRDLISRLDDLPLPDYSFLPSFTEYRDACRLPRSIAILEVGRGCPHRCVYCSESILWRRRTRTFSVPRLVQEMKNLSQNFGAECFLLAYDQFTANRAFVESFCRRIIEEGLNGLPWYCISRLDSVDATLLGIMREAGCESMCYGIDSGSKRTLAFIRKNIDHSLLYKRVVETAEQGIIPTLSFVIGFPEEEKEDIDETLNLALRAGITGNNNPLIQLPTVLPGTDLYLNYRDRLVREVDTYFSLGLEFDNGNRLEEDEDIINDHPSLFSSFYNLPCPGLPLKELNLIASFFPLIVRFYPKSFLLLSINRKESISGLFIQWLHWLKTREARETFGLSPQDCFLYFGDFARDMFSTIENGQWNHLPSILDYEDLSIEVGKYRFEKSPFLIDLNNIQSFKPMKSDKVLIESFDYHIPSIISDLKNGEFREQYTQEKTVLLFRQEEDMLNVSEVNTFTRDFLNFCNGKSSLDDIAKDLYDRYGENMDPEGFFSACLEALKALNDEGLVSPK